MQISLTNIIIIDLLPEDELQTGLALLRRLQDELSSVDFRLVAYKKVQTEAELDAFLLHVRAMARVGCKPIIHIECHGDEARGLKLRRGYFSWSRLLAHLQKINLIAKNNLVLFISGCYGTAVLPTVDITKPSPFRLLISSNSTVKAGFIQDKVGVFYIELMATSDVRAAAASIEPAFRVSPAEYFFISAFAMYVRHQSHRKARQARLERLVDRIGFSGVDRTAARRQMRAALRDHESAFIKYGAIFLHGQQYFSYSDFIRAFPSAAA